MNVAVALLSALVVLPPLLVWADAARLGVAGQVPDEVLRGTTADQPAPNPWPAERPAGHHPRLR